MEKIGTNYGGWYVPIEAKLNNLYLPCAFFSTL